MGELTFYFDRTFGNKIPRALRMLSPPFSVEWHDGNRFHKKTPDDEWLKVVGQKGWVVLTQDRKFHSIQNEAMAVVQHQVGVFYTPCADWKKWDSLRLIIARSEKLVEICATKERPFIFELKKNGRFYEKKLPDYRAPQTPNEAPVEVRPDVRSAVHPSSNRRFT